MWSKAKGLVLYHSDARLLEQAVACVFDLRRQGRCAFVEYSELGAVVYDADYAAPTTQSQRHELIKVSATN